jgi:hypothetical protein
MYMNFIAIFPFDIINLSYNVCVFLVFLLYIYLRFHFFSSVFFLLFYPTLLQLFSTTIRAWNPTMMEDLNESIFYLFNTLFPFLNGNIHGIRRSKIPHNHLNNSVFNYIKQNNLYFYSIQSRRKRLIFNFFRVIILLALVFIVMKYFII